MIMYLKDDKVQPILVETNDFMYLKDESQRLFFSVI